MPRTSYWLLFALLILLPLGLRLATRALVMRGDPSPQRRAQVLEHFTVEEIDAGREYRQAYQPGSALASVIHWGLLAWFLFGGVGRALADWAGRHCHGWLVLEVLVVAVPLFLLLRLALLPITYYHGFVLEGDFGFRRLDFLPWLWRMLKGWEVSGVTQLVIGIGFFWLVRHLGDRWLWPTVAGGAAVSYLFIILWPLLILPLFFRVTPVPDGELRQGIEKLATQAGLEIQHIRLVDQSRVSAHENAFFVGIGNRRSIYLYDTLTESHDTPQILAVVAHEIGHWQHRHMLQSWLLGIAGLAIGLALLRWFLALPVVAEVLHLRGIGDLAIIPLLWALTAGVGTLTSPIESSISRHFERQSDRASLELTGDPDTFIEMKRGLARKNRSDLLPHPLIVFWYASHPPVIDRIRAAEEYHERTLGPDKASRASAGRRAAGT